jgi:predicted regulator of Ras-like GTPase activity (Roadblock/LC7/MglB family)
MSDINIEELNKELKKLEDRSEIIGSAIVKRNGLLITSRLPRDIDEREFGALTATIFGAIETAGTSLESKTVNNITVEFNNYQLIALDANDYIFVSLLDLNVNLGLILVEIEESIKIIKKIL